jgi:transposase
MATDQKERAMRPYSMDLRERVAAAVDAGEGSLREIAGLFRVSLSFVARLLRQRRDTGSLAPAPHGGGPIPVLSADDQQRLKQLAREHNDDTLEQLRQRGQFRCSLTTIWRALRRQGLTHKKKSQHADEQERPDVQKKRQSFRRRVKRIDAGRLVFVDETGVTTAMTPAYGWARRGERAIGSAPGAWETVTVIAALGLDGVRAPLAFVGATDTAAFESYVEQVLVPELRTGDVVVWDNLAPHQARTVAAAVKRAGAGLLPLPPYSPDYTPIEEMWSKVKAYLCRVAARTKDDLYESLGHALRRVTVMDILGWFQKAGLCATHG